jgi:hypothetical protein
VIESIGGLSSADDGWMRFHGQQCGSTLRLFNRRLAEADDGKDVASATRPKALCSRLESLAGQFPGKPELQERMISYRPINRIAGFPVDCFLLRM